MVDDGRRGPWRCLTSEALSERGSGTTATIEKDMGPIWRILTVVAGFGVATAGWALVMTALLSFIGLPLFVFGLALMQSAERR
jgi:hypothetical protein